MEAALASMVLHARPIRSCPSTLDLPKIENVVSTASLLLPNCNYRLPLDALSMRMKCSQYAPILFAANIVKISDSITDSTALIFASGKIVVVASLTLNHTRYVSQLIRTIIEHIGCMMIDGAGRIYEGSLLNRTVFQHCRIHNIVGSGDLHCRIDLQSMVDAAPMACKWFPDLFPGLKCKIWLTKSHTCECTSTLRIEAIDDELEEPLKRIIGKQRKCSCAVKMLIFASGRIVITGARSVSDINGVFYRIKQLVSQFTVENAQRFDKETLDILVPTVNVVQAAVATSGNDIGKVIKTISASGNTKKRQKVTSRPPEGVAGVEAAQTYSAPPPPAGGQGDSSSLMKLCFAGRIKDVRLLLQIDKQQITRRDGGGQTVLQRMESLPVIHQSEHHAEIIDLLKIFS